MTFGVVIFLVAAVIHISLICCTKLITNYSAWMAARVWAVNDQDPNGKAREAAKQILKAMDWGVNDSNVQVNVEGDNEGVEVRYRTPLGIPFLLANNSQQRITTLGWGTVPRKRIDETGDNRER